MQLCTGYSDDPCGDFSSISIQVNVIDPVVDSEIFKLTSHDDGDQCSECIRSRFYYDGDHGLCDSCVANERPSLAYVNVSDSDYDINEDSNYSSDLG